jgi:hypothetical protein
VRSSKPAPDGRSRATLVPLPTRGGPTGRSHVGNARDAEVLEVRAGRVAMVRDLLATLTSDELNRRLPGRADRRAFEMFGVAFAFDLDLRGRLGIGVAGPLRPLQPGALTFGCPICLHTRDRTGDRVRHSPSTRTDCTYLERPGQTGPGIT